MEIFLQQLIYGLSLGSMYALIALGYTMVYGIIRLINFAHGDILMVGAYIGYATATYLHWPFIPTLLAAMIGSGLLGVLIEKIAYKPLRRATTISLLITAIGVSLLLENGFNAATKGAYLNYPGWMDMGSLKFFGLQIQAIQIIVIIVSLVLAAGLSLIVYKTKIGKAMRATSYDKDAAALMGINVDTTISATFAIGSMLAGATGVLYALLYNNLYPLMGIMPGIKAFVAAVLGGIGIIPGALLGGILLGLVETVGKYFVSDYAEAIAFIILIIILIFKPSGLLGKTVREKV